MHDCHLVLLALQFLCAADLGRAGSITVNVVAAFVDDPVVGSVAQLLTHVALAHSSIRIDECHVLEEVARWSFLLLRFTNRLVAAHVDAGLFRNVRSTRQPVDVHRVAFFAHDLDSSLIRLMA